MDGRLRFKRNCSGRAAIAAARVGISYLFFAMAQRARADSLTAGEGLVIEAIEPGGEEPPV